MTLITALAAAPMQVAATAPLAPARPPVRERTIRLDVTLLLNGSPAGEVSVEATTAGLASVDVQQLLARITPIVDRTIVDEVTRRAAGRAMVPVAELNSPNFPIFYDPAALQLKADLPATARAVTDLSLSSAAFLAGATPGDPSGFAFGVSLTATDRLESNGFFRQLDRQPLDLAAQGFVNLGGKDGYYLTFLTGLREGGAPFRRRTTLFRDDVDRAIRYAVGDLSPLTIGSFATATNMVGAGVERLYQTIQPYRNLRPSGRGGLTIERPSRVEVLVNGAPYRVLDLAPGRYNIRDFPFLDGVNDVQLVVRDDSGRNETIGVSFFSDVELLAGGLSIFSANIGFRQDSFGQFANTRYRGSPFVSGLLQVGLSDALTVGGSFQSDQRNSLATGQVAIGTPIGLFGVEAAVDRGRGEPVQGAVQLSYRLTRSGTLGRQQRLDIDVQGRTSRFTPLELADTFRNRYTYDISARFQTPLPARLYGTFGAGYSKARIGPDLRTASAGLSRTFGRLSINANYTYRTSETRNDHRAQISLNLPLGRRSYARATYDSFDNRATLNYSRQAFEGLNQTGADVTLGRDDAGTYANVDLEHYGNRARFLLLHDSARVGGQTSQRTDIAVTTGIGYADGQAAIGRDPGRGFVIVAKDPSLRDSRVTVSNQYTLGPSARTGALGPALVPIQRQYQPDALQVDVANLPLGYDIGPGRFNIVPGPGSGYLWKIGSEESNTVMGRLLLADGSPAALLSGVVQPIASTQKTTVMFFTNRTGRMVAQRLAPGRYALIPAGQTRPFAEFTIPKDAHGLVDVGVLKAKE